MEHEEGEDYSEISSRNLGSVIYGTDIASTRDMLDESVSFVSMTATKFDNKIT